MTQHGPCPNCLRQKSRIVEGKEKPVDCSSCLAETLVRGKTMRGIMSEENAKKHCLCFATGHKGYERQQPNESYLKVLEKYKEKQKKEVEEQESVVFQKDLDKQKEIEYIQERISFLRQKDEEVDGVWMGDNDE